MSWVKPMMKIYKRRAKVFGTMSVLSFFGIFCLSSADENAIDFPVLAACAIALLVVACVMFAGWRQAEKALEKEKSRLSAASMKNINAISKRLAK